MNDYEKNRILGTGGLLALVLGDVIHARQSLAELQARNGKGADRRKAINAAVLVAHADVREVRELLFAWMPIDPLTRMIRTLALRDIAPAKDRLYDAAQCRNATPATMRRCHDALLKAEAHLETAVRFSLTLPEGV